MCVNTKLAQSADSEEVFTVCVRRCFRILREEGEEGGGGGGKLGRRWRMEDRVETEAREKWSRSREACGKHGDGGCRSRRRPWAASWDEVASEAPSR